MHRLQFVLQKLIFLFFFHFMWLHNFIPIYEKKKIIFWQLFKIKKKKLYIFLYRLQLTSQWIASMHLVRFLRIFFLLFPLNDLLWGFFLSISCKCALQKLSFYFRKLISIRGEKKFTTIWMMPGFLKAHLML